VVELAQIGGSAKPIDGIAMKFFNTQKHHAVIQPRSAGHSSGNKTRSRLLDEALRLFSRDGIGAVSIRTIVGEAGAQNLSAVHYHFGNKNGLVDAIVEQICTDLLPAQAAALDALSELESPTPRDILQSAFVPHLDMAIGSARGLQQARFLARLSWEEGERGQELLMTDVFGHLLTKVDELLAKALPNKPREELQMHLMMVLVNVLHGPAEREAILLSPMRPMLRKYANHPERVREAFFDYLAAGISC